MQQNRQAHRLKQNQSPDPQHPRSSFLPPIAQKQFKSDSSIFFDSQTNSFEQGQQPSRSQQQDTKRQDHQIQLGDNYLHPNQFAQETTRSKNNNFNNSNNGFSNQKELDHSFSTDHGKNYAPDSLLSTYDINDLQNSRQKKKCCCNKCCLEFCFFYKYACMSIKRKKCQFVLAFLACFLVVLVTLVANTVLQNGSLIFFSTAEGSVGQKDMIIRPSGIGNKDIKQFLNVTHINAIVETSKITPVSPRFTIQNGVICKDSCLSASDSIAFTFTALNTLQEFENGLGTRYSLRDQGKIPMNSCHISQNFGRRLNIGVNDNVELSLDISDLFGVLVKSYQYNNPDEAKVEWQWQNIFNTGIICNVSGLYGQIGGRQGDGKHTVVYMQIETLFQHMAQFINTKDQKFKDYVATLNASQFATLGMINFKDPRIDLYLNSDYDELQKQATQTTNSIVTQLGFYPLTMDLPILSQLQVLSLGSVFFGIILSLIVVLLAVLSIMLIYSLLMVSIETKTFQIAIIRMLGISKCEIIGMLLTQAFTFVFPSLIVAYFVSFPILVMISNVFKNRVNYGFQPVPTGLATLYAMLLGIGIPILSSLIPIRTALSKSLSESIDYNRSKTQAVIYEIIQGSQSGKIIGIIFGIVAVVFGIGIYYFLPLSILSMNLALLFNLFFGILVGMLVGFILIAINAQHLLEVILLYLFFFWEKKSTLKVVLKNLTAHRLRNQKTSLMYALSVSFSIMIISAYTMQLKATSQQWIQRNGAYLLIRNYNGISMNSINPIIDNNMHIIDQYSLASSSPSTQDSSDVNETIISDPSRIQNMKMYMHAYSTNLFSSLVDGFVKVSQRTNSALSFSEQLYTARGSQSFGCGANVLTNTGVSPNRRDKYLVLNLQNSNNRMFNLMHPAWSLDSMSAFKMRDRPAKTGSLAVSFPTLRRISGYKSIRDIPIQSIYVKFNSSANQKDKDAFYDQIEYQYNDGQQGNVNIVKYQDVASSIESVQSLLDLIFSIVLVIVMFLCFFSLVASMSANIMDQAKQIAVLRSLGMTRGRVTLMYVYEAFLLVFASSMLGIFIGTIVGWTMVLQRVLFLQLPLEFYFPYWQTLAVFFVAIICAFASSCAPARNLLKKQIAQIVRTHA